MMKQFKAKYNGTEQYLSIQNRLKLLKYDDATTEQEKSEIIQQIRDMLYLNFNHYKPEDINKLNQSMSSLSEDDTTPTGGNETAGAPDDPFSM